MADCLDRGGPPAGVDAPHRGRRPGGGLAWRREGRQGGERGPLGRQGRLLSHHVVRAGGGLPDPGTDHSDRAAQPPPHQHLRVRPSHPGRGFPPDHRLDPGLGPETGHCQGADCRQAGRAAERRGRRGGQETPPSGQEPGRYRLLADLSAVSAGSPQRPGRGRTAGTDSGHGWEGSGVHSQPLHGRGHPGGGMVRGPHRATGGEQPAGSRGPGHSERERRALHSAGKPAALRSGGTDRLYPHLPAGGDRRPQRFEDGSHHGACQQHAHHDPASHSGHFRSRSGS